MNSEHVILALIAMNVIQLIWYSVDRHRMLNKLMSRSFYDYQLATSLPKVKKTPEVAQDIPLEEFMSEMGVMDDMISKL